MTIKSVVRVQEDNLTPVYKRSSEDENKMELAEVDLRSSTRSGPKDMVETGSQVTYQIIKSGNFVTWN